MNQQVSACERLSGDMAPEHAPKQTVWVLEIQHRHGNDITVHASEDSARDALSRYCWDWWGEAFEGEDEPPHDLTNAAIIDRYFAAQEDESSDIFACEVQS